MTTTPVGVLLMTFGSATTADDVVPYLRSVRGGNDPAPEVVEEFRRRYEIIKRSPLIDITRAQADALQGLLNTAAPAQFVVEVGMRHSDPFIDDAVESLAQRGVRDVLGIVMSPQYSPIIMSGYRTALETSAHARGMRATLAGPWHLVEGFVRTLTESIESGLLAFDPMLRPFVPIVFTAHSLPRSVVERDQEYITQIQETVLAVVERAGIEEGRWLFAYQSAGHTQEEWLTPDFKDLIPPLRDAGHGAVLVVPTQFLADHLEILYDIDVAGRDEAEVRGMTFSRTPMPNTRSTFIEALADVVVRDAPVLR